MKRIESQNETLNFLTLEADRLHAFLSFIGPGGGMLKLDNLQSKVQLDAMFHSSVKHGDERLKLSDNYSLNEDESAFRIDEILENTSGADVEFLRGMDFIIRTQNYATQCQIQAPAASYFDPREEPILRMRWPHLADGTDISKIDLKSAEAEVSYYLNDFTDGRCSVLFPEKKSVVELRWDVMQFPYLWLKYSANRCILAPYSGLPNAVEEGHGLAGIPAGGKQAARFEITVNSL